ncbi:MAG: hypothetical protein G4V63_03415 [Candidatus Afipia apatlaquensis]|uniref:Nitroreductase domain-containing protein n=1 Tax=Candidatus Afipia apatlaquensis TaxID=2712852 RepID=A0A7C9VDA5_9BRAD|nr:hypothetical protein [Candidatus Afipia apatlaquensis]
MATNTEPTPKLPHSDKSKERWRLSSTMSELPELVATSKSFSEVAAERRTVRRLSELELDSTMAIIRMIALSREIGVGSNKGRHRKLTISAGALHPVEVLIVSGPAIVEPIIYSDTDDIFGTVTISQLPRFNAEIEGLRTFLPNSSGHFLMFVGNARHVERSYNDPLSLLWRDAGAMMQMFALYASAYGFAFVPLGSTGSGILESIDSPHEDYLALGTALMGRALP